MATNLRRLGVYGENLPVRKTLTVRPSDFLIGGIIGKFERKYNKAFLVTNEDEFKSIFGDHVISTYYGWDAVKGFFQNAVGVDAKLYVSSFVGTADGTTIDAVVATRSISDVGVIASLQIDAGYETIAEYGISGNRTSSKVTAGVRFTTAAAAACPATAQSFAILDSVVGIKVGDLVTFNCSGGTPGVEVKKIIQVDESTKKVYWTGDLSAAAATLVIDDPVTVYGFRLQTYRKDIKGIEREVDVELGKIWCTMEPEVSDYYAPNVFATSKWLKLTDLVSTSVGDDRFLVTEPDPVPLASGANGTEAITLAAQYDLAFATLNNLPVRLITQTMSTLQAVNEAGDTYCKARTDTPLWLYLIPENQTKTQLVTIGNNYQRSNEVGGVIVANWLQVEDPFSTSILSLPRNIPNVGHTMGAWMRAIGLYGIHFVPAVKQNPIYGTIGIVGNQFLSDIDRTTIAEAGVNIIQNLSGIGTIIRNFFTPSVETAYQFANGIFMRNFIKISVVDSLQTSENTPNSINRIKEDKMAALQFLYRLWDGGSTGNVPIGESFGRTQDAAGIESSPENHFQVQADVVNNPQSAINAGERNIDIYFTYPTPAGSIKIGVGILLLA